MKLHKRILPTEREKNDDFLLTPELQSDLDLHLQYILAGLILILTASTTSMLLCLCHYVITSLRR